MITRAVVSLALCFGCVWGQQNVSRQTWDTESGLPQNTVQAILQTQDGYMWFATEGGLARFDSERFRIFNTRNTPELRSNDIRSLRESPAGMLWIGTADGLTLFSTHARKTFTIADGLPSNVISRVFVDPSQRLCVATGAGNACFQGNLFAQSDIRTPIEAADRSLQSFVASPVLCSLKDREGDVWIGTETTGLTILRELPFHAFSERDQGLDGQVRCVFSDRAGAIWFGTDSQGLIRYAHGEFKAFTVANGLSSNVIVSLGQDQSGDLLIGTPDGLNRLHGQTVTAVTSSDGLPDDFIRSIHTDPDGIVWIGTRRGLVRWSDRRFRTFTHSDGLGSDLIGSIARDRNGFLWVATLQGLSRFDGSRFLNFTTKDGLSSDVITALFVDRQSSVWIGTQGGGLNIYSAGKIKHLTWSGLPDVIYGIGEDARNDLWLASDTGIDRIALPAAGFDSGNAEAIVYGVSDGLRVNECSGGGHPGVVSDRNGGLWFATLKGAAYLLPRANFDTVRPPVKIESVTVDNRTMEWMPSMSILPGYSRLVFDYAAMSFTAPQKVLFRYELEGFEKKWVDAGNTRTAVYTNLGPGDYTFHVMARNGDGVWNREGAALGLHLEPHFYQTWWFGILMLLPLAASGYGIYKWRLARVEEQMESRFQAVLQERNRIAREIHDTLAQGFAGVSVQLEIVSRKVGAQAGAVREHLDQARMLVRSSLAEARRSIWELRSQSNEIEDLASRLSKMAAQMSSSGQPKISVQVRGTFRPLPPRTEDELLRIAQEAVTNAIRHAQASEIQVELAFDPKLFRMTVADDGRGFTPDGKTSGVNGHFGLKGMQERADGIDAKLKLDTAPGAGTRLSVEVPV